MDQSNTPHDSDLPPLNSIKKNGFTKNLENFVVSTNDQRKLWTITRI